MNCGSWLAGALVVPKRFGCRLVGLMSKIISCHFGAAGCPRLRPRRWLQAYQRCQRHLMILLCDIVLCLPDQLKLPDSGGTLSCRLPSSSARTPPVSG